jgi:hypothetical protein
MTGATGIMLTRGNIDGILELFFFSIIPNLFIFITIHFLAHRLNLNKKHNVVFCAIFISILFYFTVFDLMNFGTYFI